MVAQHDGKVRLETIDVPLDRDLFLRTLIRHLAGALEDIVGFDEASGFISIVGQQMGDELNLSFRMAMHVDKLDRAQVAAVCVDLKRRINGDFYVISEDDDKIVFGSRACPYGDKVIDRPVLCMTTSNVFGTIAAENLGYGKVVLEQTIARGDRGCRVVLYLRVDEVSEAACGREYVRSE